MHCSGYSCHNSGTISAKMQGIKNLVRWVHLPTVRWETQVGNDGLHKAMMEKLELEVSPGNEGDLNGEGASGRQDGSVNLYLTV